MKEQKDSEFLGLTKEEAVRKANYENLIVKIVEENGKHFNVTYDCIFDRINVTIKDDKVVAIFRG